MDAPLQKLEAVAPPKPDGGGSGGGAGGGETAKPPSVLSARERTVVEEYRDRITKIYSDKQPTKVDEIDKFLDKYKGQEQVLYLKICKKYSIEAEPEYKVKSPFGCGLSVLGLKCSTTPD